MSTKSKISILSALLATSVLGNISTASAMGTGYIGTVRPLSDWSVQKIDASSVDVPYCASVNKFEQGINIAMAKNASGDVSLALTMSKGGYITGQTLPVKLSHEDGLLINAKGHVVSPTSVMVQLGQGYELTNALVNEGFLTVELPDIEMRVSLISFEKALAKLESCAGSFPSEVHEIEEVRAIAPENFEELTVTQVETPLPAPVKEVTKVKPLTQEPKEQQATLEINSQSHDQEVTHLASELSALIEETNAEPDAANTQANKDRIEALERQLSEAVSARQAEQARAEDLKKKLAEVELEKRDQARRADIETLSERAVEIDGQPVVRIQKELLSLQSDLERQALSQAQEAEWLERRKLEIAKSVTTTPVRADIAQAQRLERQLLEEKQRADTLSSQLSFKDAEITKLQKQFKARAPEEDVKTPVASVKRSQITWSEERVKAAKIQPVESVAVKAPVQTVAKVPQAETPVVQVVELEDKVSSKVEARNIRWAPTPTTVPFSKRVVQGIDVEVVPTKRDVMPQAVPKAAVDMNITLPNQPRVMASDVVSKPVAVPVAKVAPPVAMKPQSPIKLKPITPKQDLPITVISSDENVVLTPDDQRKTVMELPQEEGGVIGAESYIRAKTLIDDLMQNYEPRAGEGASLEEPFVANTLGQLNILAATSSVASGEFVEEILLPTQVQTFANEVPTLKVASVVKVDTATSASLASDLTKILSETKGSHERVTLDGNKNIQTIAQTYLDANLGGNCKETGAMHEVYALSEDVSIAEVVCDKGGVPHYIAATFYKNTINEVSIISHSGLASNKDAINDINLSIAETVINIQNDEASKVPEIEI